MTPSDSLSRFPGLGALGGRDKETHLCSQEVPSLETEKGRYREEGKRKIAHGDQG